MSKIIITRENEQILVTNIKLIEYFSKRESKYRDIDNISHLLRAVKDEDVELVKLLLKYNAPVCYSTIIEAHQSGNSEIIELLESDCEKIQKIMEPMFKVFGDPLYSKDEDNPGPSLINIMAMKF